MLIVQLAKLAPVGLILSQGHFVQSYVNIMNINNRQFFSFINLLPLIFTLIATGCNKGKDYTNEKLKNILTEYVGQELMLPGDSICSLFNRSYGVDFLDADYLIVSYIDTKGCTPCRLHLPYWKELSDRLDALSNAYATTVLIIRPDTLEKVTEFIQNANYNYPVIIDTLGRFSEMNRLPDFQSLHTFLIDNRHAIKGLGNPIENRAIDRIYMKIISGGQFETINKSPLIIENNTVDMGTIPPGANREFIFWVKNQSNDTMTISNVMTPCDCINVSVSDIMPASKGTVKISFQASETNEVFHHPIVVRYNDVTEPIIIHLYGMVSF